MLLNQRSELLTIARESIRYGLDFGQVMPINVNDFDEALTILQATFVTLEQKGKLRGCIGCLEASRPLVKDITINAYKAAFEDPRFEPLRLDEWPEIRLSISLLQPATALEFHSEADLIRQIRPGVDGLILQEGYHRSTFLPSVWESLPDPTQFVQHLKQKAGLSSNYWSEALEMYRYTVEYITEKD